MISRNEQAAKLFGEVVEEIVSGKADLVSVLRKAFHACGLAGWSESQRWFRRELEGYPIDTDLPWYRHVPGETEWRPAGAFDIAAYAAKRMARGETELAEPARLDCRNGIPSIVKWAELGLMDTPTETRQRVDAHNRPYNEKRSAFYPAQSFQQIIRVVENFTFEFASNHHVALTYGDALESIWEGYRARVEPVLGEVGLGKHLEIIRDAVASDNPEAWRNAVWACRDILHDLADRIWRDPRETYPGLLDKSGKSMIVDEAHYINRLKAYLHVKGVAGRAGEYLRSEVERIDSSVHALYNLENKAHASISRDDVRLVAMGTYVLLGELVLRTDLSPVENYDLAEIAGASSGED